MAPPIVVNGQVGLQSSRQQLAAAGKYFVVTNPTPGTAIAYALQTGFSATANGLFLVQNNNPSGGASIQLDRLELLQTAAAATGTLAMRFEVFNETGIVALSGAFSARTPVNVNSAYSSVTGAIVHSFAAGAATVPAAVGTRRQVGLGFLPTGLTFIHDSFVVDFGGDSVASAIPGLTAARLTTPGRYVCQMPPVTIAPQTSSWINMWWVTAAANIPSFEFQLAYVEL